jgi:HK97 family phage prohead protease
MSDETPDAIEQREVITGDLIVRDAEKREIEARIVPWNTVIHTSAGREMFAPGAFSDTEAGSVVLRMSHQDPPAGRGLRLEDRDDGAYMAFRVSKTPKGDEILTLASDGVTKGVSVGFETVPGGTEYRDIDDHRTSVYTRATLREVSTTWMPAYPQAQILAIRKKEDAPMAESTAAESTTAVDLSAISTQITASLEARDAKSAELQEKVLDRLEKIEERERAAIIVPSQTERKEPQLDQWLEAALKFRVGEPLNQRELEERELSDVLLSDQAVPTFFRPQIEGFLAQRRRFLATTGEVAAPDAGTAIQIPIVTSVPEAGVQSEEKTEVASNPLKIESATINGVTVAGAVDISYQFIRRGPRTYFDLLRRAMLSALNASAEAEAVAALLNGVSYGSSPTTVTPTSGDAAIDPDDLEIGDSWLNAMEVVGEEPDTLWVSPNAVKRFIDAKDNGSNRPLYSTIVSDITAGGVRGSVQGLRFVPVPALADSGVDAIIGPSSYFAWAEDGTFELSADKPAILGRDLALATYMFFMPLAPAAFTTYTLASP